MTIERARAAPLSFDWCALINCPHQTGYCCGIDERLRRMSWKARKAEAERLYELAQEDPIKVQKICIDEIIPY